MENITLQSMVKEFSSKNSFSSEKESVIFEKFVSHSLFSNEYYDSYNQDEISTGSCIGIDSVAIAISDVLVYSIEEARILTKGQFDVKFYFVQSKTSSKLDSGEYLKFLNTIYLFFKGCEEEQPLELQRAFGIKKHIYDKASKFRELPSINMYYVYTGNEVVDDSNFENQINVKVCSIREIDYISSKVINNLIGGYAIADLYKESLNRITKKMCFQRHVALPKLRNATAAYLGVAKCSDYIELLNNQHGQVNKGLFYDNVRDYLGASNPVNSDIEETIKSNEKRNLFSVLNNGVTIVAKKVIPSGDEFEISGFQVVNGCQTSHVLFNNKDHVTDDMYITVKLIETNDIDLASSVIKATNSQSLVMKEAFATIKPYHKKLENYFIAMQSHNHKFYYERRPHQFDDDEEITKAQIVSAPLLIKAFISVIKEEPHQVHFYYGQILKEYNTEKSTLLFDDNHNPGLYFVSHLLSSKAKEVALKKRLNPWSYHIALLIKKKLNIRLRVEDSLDDKKILEIISIIESGFYSAATEVIDIIKEMNPHKNENMNAKKTTEMIEFFYRKISNKGGMDLQVTKSNKIISDGEYIVCDISLIDHKLNFRYGKEFHKLPYSQSLKLDHKIKREEFLFQKGLLII